MNRFDGELCACLRIDALSAFTAYLDDFFACLPELLEESSTVDQRWLSEVGLVSGRDNFWESGSKLKDPGVIHSCTRRSPVICLLNSL